MSRREPICIVQELYRALYILHLSPDNSPEWYYHSHFTEENTEAQWSVQLTVMRFLG